jgi:type II secretory pathway pseudopilin PulG
MDTQAQQDLRNILQAMKKAQLAAGPASMALRRDRLQRSVRLIQENHQALADAISADFAHCAVNIKHCLSIWLPPSRACSMPPTTLVNGCKRKLWKRDPLVSMRGSNRKPWA